MRPLTPLPSALFAAVVIASTLPAPSAYADPPLATALAETAPSPPEDDTRALRFTAGVSLTGLGLLTAALGGVLAARAAIAKRDIGTHCDAAARCDLIGYSLSSEVADFSTTATALIPAGLALAGAGVGLLISTAPKRPRAAAWISPTPGGLVLSGSARW